MRNGRGLQRSSYTERKPRKEMVSADEQERKICVTGISPPTAESLTQAASREESKGWVDQCQSRTFRELKVCQYHAVIPKRKQMRDGRYGARKPTTTSAGAHLPCMLGLYEPRCCTKGDATWRHIQGGDSRPVKS